MSLHEQLEAKLATFKHVEATLTFQSGFTANTGVIPILAPEGATIVSDALNHASIIDGARLSRATIKVFPHRDIAGARKAASPADSSKLPPANRQSTGRCSCTCQGPGVIEGSCICTASDVNRPRQAEGDSVPPTRPATLRSSLRWPRSACPLTSSTASRKRPCTCSCAASARIQPGLPES